MRIGLRELRCSRRLIMIHAVQILAPDTWGGTRSRSRPSTPRPCRSPAGPTSWLSSTSTACARRTMLALTAGARAARVGVENGRLRVGAGVSYTRIIDELGDRLPSLAVASRTGRLSSDPQSRGRSEADALLISPAGRDAEPPLLYVSGAEVELASVGGVRRVAIDEFITGTQANLRARGRAHSAFGCCRVRRAPSSSPRSARATRWSSRVCSVALAIWP